MTILYYIIAAVLLASVIFVYGMLTAPMMDEKGNLIDKEGNIVDDHGRIIKSIEEIKKEYAEELKKAMERNK
jgi:hypothetical protein